MKRALPAALLAGGLLGGCPIFAAPTCADGGACPGGLVCCTDDYCRPPGAVEGCGGTTGRAGTSSGSSGGTSGGSTGWFTLACPTPVGAGWPTQCTGPMKVMDLSFPSDPEEFYAFSDVSVVGLGSGAYLVGAVDQFLFAQFAGISDGGAWDAGYVDCAVAPCPTGTLSLVPGGAGASPTLIAGYYPSADAGTGTIDSIACWSPFSASAPSVLSVNVGDAGAFSVGTVRAAVGSGGMAIAVTDELGVQYLAFSDGGCPVAPLQLQKSSYQASASGIAALPAGQFLWVETGYDGSETNPQNSVSVVLEPSGTSLTQSPYGGPGEGAPPVTYVAPLATLGAASDGQTAVGLTGDAVEGLQLFSASLDAGGGEVAPVSLAPGFVSTISAANCGADCTVAAWIQSDAGGANVEYGFFDGEGCGQGAVMRPGDLPALSPPLATAVAVQDGQVAIAAAFAITPQVCDSSSCDSARVYLQICSSP